MRTLLTLLTALGFALATAAMVGGQSPDEPLYLQWDSIAATAIDDLYPLDPWWNGPSSSWFWRQRVDDAGWSAFLGIVASRLLGKRVEVDVVTLESPQLEKICGPGIGGGGCYSNFDPWHESQSPSSFIYVHRDNPAVDRWRCLRTADSEEKCEVSRFSLWVLIHELAHLLDAHASGDEWGEWGRNDNDRTPHDPVFQTWLARLYHELLMVDLRPYCKQYGVDCDWER